MQYGLTIEAIIELFGEQICDCPRCKERRGAETDNEGSPLPPVYQDLDDVGQGLLWLAHHGNRRVQAWNNLERRWEDDEDDVLYPQVRYRVKPEPEVEADNEGNPLPPAYRDLANEDKNLLWHADDLGLGVQFWNGLQRRWENDSDFDPTACRAFSKMRYRVKPEGTDAAPAREPIKIQGPSGEILGSGTMLRRDGEWDFDSIEVED